MNSSVQHLTPALERLLIDEVRYLHNLWRRGPDRNPNPTRNLNLGTSTSTAFKKKDDRKKWKPKKQLQTPNLPEKHPQPSDQCNGTTASDDRWLCPLAVAQDEITGWPEVKPKPKRAPKPVSAGEKERFVAYVVQQDAQIAYQDFVKEGNLGSDGEEEEDSMEEDDDNEDDSVESRTFAFFVSLFEKKVDLREYFEKNWEKGEFVCLVCSGMGKKTWKKYRNCTGLVQHSNTISKTKRRGAHRAFARAICLLLGWDINRLPSVLSKDEALGQSLAKATIPQETSLEVGDAVPKECLSKDVEV